MRVSELYGPVAQGEGALCGVTMPFLRVGGCNLTCSWCDSSYTWRKGYSYVDIHVDDIERALVARIPFDALAHGGAWVSVTGGEPTIYARELYELCALLRRRHVRVIVETNGLRDVAAFTLDNVFVSCSPKLPSSGQDTPLRRERVKKLVATRNATRQLRERTQYKFVVAESERPILDVLALLDYCADVGIDVSGARGSSPVYAQPNGYIEPTDAYLAALDALWRVCANVAPGVRVTPQVHRLLHGPNARGV